MGTVAVVIVLASVLAVLVFVGPTAAMAASVVLTCGVAAVSAPRAFRIAAFGGLAVLPLLEVFPALRPSEFHYPLVLSAAVLCLVGLGALQPRMFTASLGTACLVYLTTAATVALLRQPEVRGLTTFSYIPMALAVYTLVRRSTGMERRIAVSLILLLGVVEGALALTQSVLGWPVFSEVLPELRESERNYFAYLVPGLSHHVTQGSGTFTHFNSLGAYLSLCLPLAVGMWMQKRRSPWLFAAVVIVAGGLVSSFSRGALLGAIVGVSFVLWFGPARSRRATLVLVAACLALVSLFGLTVFTQYYESTQNASIRVQTWRMALNTALDTPSSLLLGFGYRHFSTEVLVAGLASEALTRKTTYMSSLHSSHLQLLLEFGVLGFGLAVGWLATALSRVTRSCSRSALAIAALGGVLGLLCSQLLDNALLTFPGVVLVTLVGIAESETLDRTS